MRKLVKRWLVVPLGLGLAAVAGWALLSSSGSSTRAKSPASHEAIDQQSRDELRKILLEADEGLR